MAGVGGSDGAGNGIAGSARRVHVPALWLRRTALGWIASAIPPDAFACLVVNG